MNWLTNFIRPKIRSFVTKKDVPENLWHKCPSCEGMMFHTDLKKNLNVCYHCNYHLNISVNQRLSLLFDDGKFEEVSLPKVPHDPLKFKDRKKYSDRLKEAHQKTGRQDALVIAKGTIGGNKVVIAAFDFAFMGGSMGAAVGAGIVKAAQIAVSEKAAFITIPSSGGARMQEGAISLMQMPKTIVSVQRVREAGLPYFVLLTNPTTGGVSASFAMLGDIHIAEPGATIGFAGKRVIQETIREELPENFQTSEYLKDHGMVDMVVHRTELRETLARLLGLIMNKGGLKKNGKNPQSGTGAKGKTSKNGKADKSNANSLSEKNIEKIGRHIETNKKRKIKTHLNIENYRPHSALNIDIKLDNIDITALPRPVMPTGNNQNIARNARRASR